MKRQLLLAMIFVLGVVFIPTYSIAVLYDDFQEPNIDPNKWSTFELINRVQGGKMFSETIAYEARNTNNLNFKNPISINYIEADVTVTEIEGDFGSTGINNYSSAHARLAGTFYNDGSTSGPGSWKGEVEAMISIAPYNGYLWVYWNVWKAADDAGTSWRTLSWDYFPNPVSLNTTYKLSIQFDPSSKRLTFKVGSTIRTWITSDQIHSPNIPWKVIGTYVYFTGTATGLSGRISATFDNVIAKDETGNVVVSDDFSSPAINPDKWSYVIREISDGKLLSKVDTNGDTRNSLEFKNPEPVNEFQAKVTLLEFNNPDGALTRARLGGHFYNDTGDPNSGYEGDVFAEVMIGGEGTDPSIQWWVVRYNNAGGTATTILEVGQFPVPVNLLETYDLFLGWDGSTFIFKCNDSVAKYTPTTSKFPPNNKRKDLGTRIQPPDSNGPFEAFVSAAFDDVLVNELIEVFTDVPTKDWAYNYIIAIYNHNITIGCSQIPLKYCPENNVTREEMATFIVRAVEGEPPLNYCDSGVPFPDVTPDMWSCKYIKRLKELGITTGYQDGTYGPNDDVPREQMAAFLVRAVEGEPPLNYCDSGVPFPDVSSDMWSCKYIKRLKELGITTGYQDGTYGPYDLVTRAQMAAFLSRAFLGME